MPKLSAVLTMIPQPVIGGATISVFGTITLNGIRILVKDGLTPRACTVFGISVAFGLGIAEVSGSLMGPGMPDWINTIFGTSAITPCAIMAIILNNVLPPENPYTNVDLRRGTGSTEAEEIENGVEAESAGASAGNDSSASADSETHKIQSEGQSQGNQ